MDNLYKFVMFIQHHQGRRHRILNTGAEGVLDQWRGAGQLIVNMTKTGCCYCSVVEGSHDKESSINTPEGGFIHNMVCRSDGVLVAVLRCSPRVFRCLVDRLCFRQGRIRHKLVSGKEARDRTLILRLTGDLSLPVSGSPTAYLAVGKRAPGVADPAVTSWCRWFVFVSRATLMSARDARHIIYRCILNVYEKCGSIIVLSLLYDMAVPTQSNTPVIFGCAFCGLMRPPWIEHVTTMNQLTAGPVLDIRSP